MQFQRLSGGDVHRTLDIVVGDWGRPATVRYLELASSLERALITERLPARTVFYDEARKIDVVSLPLSRRMKRLDELSRLEPERICELPPGRILVSVFANEEQVFQLAASLLDGVLEWLPSVGMYGCVRLVVPCNTLHRVVRAARELLGAGPSRWGLLGELWTEGRLKIPSVVEEVVASLANEENLEWTIDGTPAAVEAYKQEAARRAPQVQVQALRADSLASLDPILAAVSGVKTQNVRAGSVHGLLVSGCTDFRSSGGVDSLAVFCKRLVRQAYRW